MKAYKFTYQPLNASGPTLIISDSPTPKLDNIKPEPGAAATVRIDSTYQETVTGTILAPDAKAAAHAAGNIFTDASRAIIVRPDGSYLVGVLQDLERPASTQGIHLN